MRLTGRDLDEAKQAARENARETGFAFFEDGAEPAQYQGYGAIAEEILEQCETPPVAIVYTTPQRVHELHDRVLEYQQAMQFILWLCMVNAERWLHAEAVLAELRPHVFDVGLGVLDDVVEQCSGERLLVETELGADARHPYRVLDEVGAGAPLLALVEEGALGRKSGRGFYTYD